MNEYINLYKNIVGRNKNKYIKVVISDQMINQIKELVQKVIDIKINECHHKVDHNKEFERFYTGFLGEAAIEVILNTNKIIDWSCGNSNTYNVPDLNRLGLNIGIKTSEIYKFPVISKRNTYPQIINIRYGYNTIFVCGIADVQVLNTYQNDSLILSPYLRQRNTKTGFWGFDFLKQFSIF